MGMRACRRCEREFPRSAFYTYPSGKASPYCRPCEALFSRESHARHRAERVARMRAYYSEHKAALIRQARAYYAAHADCLKARQRERNVSNGELYRAYQAERRRRLKLGIPLRCQCITCSNGHLPTPLAKHGQAWLCPHCSTGELVQVRVHLAGPLSATAVVLLRIRERAPIDRELPLDVGCRTRYGPQVGHRERRYRPRHPGRSTWD